MQRPKVPDASKAVDLAGPSGQESSVVRPAAPSVSQHKDPNALYSDLKRKLAVPNRAGTKATF